MVDELSRRSPFRWSQYTVRGFSAGLMKRSHSIEVMQRVHQVGPKKEGTRSQCAANEVAP